MRHITLLLENVTKEIIEKLDSYCKEHNIEWKCTDRCYYRNGRLLSIEDGDIIPLYYFYIISDTKGFNSLNNYMDGKIITTKYSDICNIADLDDEFEKQLSNCVELMKKSQNAMFKSNREFHNFIMPIKNVELLKALKNFEVYMTDTQKRGLRDRIDILSNNRDVIDEEMTITIKSLHCDIKELREKTGMNRKEFANYFEIPYRTVEDWENKKSTCSSYLYKLLEEKINREFC